MYRDVPIIIKSIPTRTKTNFIRKHFIDDSNIRVAINLSRNLKLFTHRFYLNLQVLAHPSLIPSAERLSDFNLKIMVFFISAKCNEFTLYLYLFY